MIFVLQVLHLAFQIDDKMRISLQSATDAVIAELRRGLRQTIAGFLLEDQVINDFVLSLELTLDDLQLGSQSGVFIL